MFFFFKAVFESFAGGLDFSVTILISKLNIQSHRKLMFMPHKWRQKEQKKALHIYIKKFGATFFSQSSQSSYTSVSRLSFLVIWHDQ